MVSTESHGGSAARSGLGLGSFKAVKRRAAALRSAAGHTAASIYRAAFCRPAPAMSFEGLERRQMFAANLQVIGGEMTPEGPVRGGSSVNISWTSKNVGDTSTANSYWYDRVFYSVDNVLSNDDHMVVNESYTYGTLTAGATRPMGPETIEIPLSAQPGPGHLLFVVDTYNHEIESDETDNVFAMPITVAEPGVDFAATSNAQTPSSLTVKPAQKNISLGFTVTNLGAGETFSYWVDAAYLSDDAILDDEDVSVGSKYHAELIGSNVSYDATVTINVPSYTPVGTGKYLLLATNANQYHPENGGAAARANNVIAIPLTVEQAAWNLTVGSAAVDGGAPTARPVLNPTAYYSVTYTGQNSGTDAMPYFSWRDAIYFSADATLDAGDTLLDTNYVEEDLAPAGATNGTDRYSRTFYDIVLPRGLHVGDGYLIVAADHFYSDGGEGGTATGPLSLVPEANEADNAFAVPITVNPYDVDIKVTDVTAPASGRLETSFTATIRGVNLGSTATARPVPFSVYLSSDGVSADHWIGSAYVGSVGANGEFEATATGTFPSAGSTLNTDHPWQLLFIADVYHDLEESDYTNNSIAVPFDLLPADVDLSVESVTSLAIATAGQEIAVTWKVKNLGTVTTPSNSWYDQIFLSVDDQLSDDDIRLDSRNRWGQLAGGAEYTDTNNWTDIPSNTPTGNYHIIVRTNRTYDNTADVNADKDGDNNFRATPIRIVRPDLAVTAASVPSPDVNVGGSLSVSWTLHNKSEAATANYWYDYFYLSTDANYDPGTDQELTYSYGSATIASGGTLDRSANVYMPSSTRYHGAQYLIVRNAGVGGTDADYTDNWKAIPVYIHGGDLRFVNPVLTPANAGPGSAATLTFTVRNDGDRAISMPSSWYNYGWRDYVYFSANDVYEYSFDRLATGGYMSSPATLQPGDSYPVTLTFTLPNDMGANFYVIGYIDAGGGVYEAGEANNFIAFPVSGTLPDLSVTDFQAPSTGSINELVSFTWTVKNLAGGPGNADWFDSFYLSTDDNYSGDDIYVGSAYTGDLTPLNPNGQAGDSYTYTYSFNLPRAAAGNYKLIAVTDRNGHDGSYSNNTQSETDETNNTRSLDFTLRVPDLTVTDVSMQAGIGSNQGGLNVTWTVKNLSTDATAYATRYDSLFISTDPYLSDTDISLSQFYPSGGIPLGPGATYTMTEVIGLPNLTSGTYYVIVATDKYGHYSYSSDQQGETDETNNYKAFQVTVSAPDLTVSAASAQVSAVLNEKINVNWTVSNVLGNAAYAQWYDAVFLSNDDKLGSGDVWLAGKLRPGETSPMAGNGSYDASMQITIPGDLGVGAKYLIFVADGQGSYWDSYSNRQGEDNETNNARAVPISLVTTNLVPSAPTVTPGGLNPVAGEGAPRQPYAFSWTVTNTGTTAAPGTWNDYVYISKSSTFDPNYATYVGSFDATSKSGLGPNGSYLATVTGELPDVTPGQWYIHLVTDATKGQSEINENDNVISVPVTIKAPNLVVQNLAVTPNNPKSGGTLNVTYNVVNSGAGTAYGHPTSGWYDYISVVNLDTNQQVANATVYHTSDGPLAGGASRPKSVSITLPHGATAVGRLEIRVTTDADYWGIENAQVHEYTAAGVKANNDNEQAVQVTSTLGTYADLTVAPDSVTITGLTGPLTSGQQAVVRWTLRNGGNAPASGFWRDRVTVKNLSTGEVFYDELIPYAGGAIAADGGTALREVAVNLPHGARGTGTLQVTVTADAGNHVFEAAPGYNAEQNNAGTGSGTSAMALYPDLRITAVSGPANVKGGGPVSITWTIYNAGDGAATGTWVDQVFLSPNDTIGGDSSAYGSFTFTGTIPAKGSVTRTQVIQLPPDLEGAFWPVVKTDAYDSLRDYPDDNNTGIAAAPMQVALREFPNLTVAKVIVPTDAFSGQKTMVKWRIQNKGDAPTGGTWTDSVYLSNNLEWDGHDTLLGRLANSTALAPWQMYESEMEVTFPRGISGTWYVIVKTDSAGRIDEPGHESDNTGFSTGINVTLTPPPDLQVVGHTFGSAFLFSGQTVGTTWTVRNVGDGGTVATAWGDAVFLSDDEFLDADDLRLTTSNRTLGALDAKAEYVGSGTISLPVGVTGSKYILFRADFDNKVFESAFENNNVRAVAVDIAPTPPPDLEVTGVQTLTPVLVGRKFKVRYQVTNTGLTPVPNSSFHDHVYLSQDDKLDLGPTGHPINGDILLYDRTSAGALAPDANGGGEVEIQLDPRMLPGNYHLIVLTDARKEVLEVADDNNVRVLPVAIGADRPNLRVTQVSAPSVGVVNGSIPVVITLVNDGDGATYDTREYLISFHLSRDSDLGSGDLELRGTIRGVRLEPGQTLTLSGTVNTENLYLTPGNYQLYAWTDSEGDQPESNESDNLSPGRAISMVVRQPNLVVSEPQAPASIDADMPLGVRYGISNNGEANAPGFFYSTVYLSRDGKLDIGTDVALSPAALEGTLATGESRTMALNLNLPITASGSYYLIFLVDSGNMVSESNEADNQVALPLYVNAYVAPDLSVTGVTAPTEAYSGRPAYVTWSVANSGGPIKNRPDGTPASWNDTVYLSVDEHFDPGIDRVLGSVRRTGPLAGPGGYAAGGSFQIPEDWSGPSYFFVVTDSGHAVYEGEAGGPGEGNNLSAKSNQTSITATPPTDLLTQPFTIPTTGMIGREVRITFTVKNVGDRTALGSWTDSLYLSADGTWDINDPLIARVVHNGNVAPQDSYEVTVTANLPGVVPGDYNIIVRSDILDHIPEGEVGEANNFVASINKIVADAEALPLNGTIPGTFGQGVATFYKLAVPAGQAGETIRLFLDALSATGANELYVAFGRMPSRVDFDFRNIEAADPDVSATIPFAKAGDYYVLAYGQGLPIAPGGNPAPITFDLSATVIPFGVTSADASAIGNNGATTLRLRGARFDGATTFALVGPGDLVVQASSVRFEDAALAYATFDLANLPTGKYAIRATDSRGVVSTLADAVTVSDAFGGRHAVSFEAPNAVRGVFPILVSWGNDGGTDLPAPLIIVTNDLELNMGFSPTRLGGAGVISFFGASHDGPAGILRAGEAYSLPLYSASLPGNIAKYRTYAVRADDPRAIDLDYLRAQLPDNVLADPNFDAVWDGIRAAVGNTWGSYVQALATLANQHTARLGDVHQPMTLLGLLADKVRASLGASITGVARSNDLGVTLAERLVTARNLATGEQFATYTLADGTFVFRSVTPGTYAFTFENAVVAGATDATVADGTPLTGVQITLAAGARVAGSVRNGSGAPVANARVTLTSNGNTYAAFTDATGSYLLEGILPGLYTLVAEADGLARARVDSLDVQTSALAHNFTLAAQARLTGTLASATAGDALAKFTVTATRRNAGTTSNPDVYTLTATEGEFSLNGLPAGTYDITVRRAGFGPQTLVATVAAGATAAAGTITLSSGAKITGTVVSDVPGINPAGLVIAAFDADGQRVASALLTTTGAYTLADLAPGTYTLRVEGMPTGFSTTRSVTVAGHETAGNVALRVVPGATIGGSLGSAAAAGLTVIATDAAGRLFTAIAAADGTYRITDLEPGTYSVGIPGVTTFQTVQILSLGDDTHTANFTVPVGTRLGGLVLTASGQPVAGARVVLLANGVPVASAEANDDGAYTFTVWQPGQYTVQAETLDASFPEAVVTLAAGEETTYVFRAGTAVAHVNVQGTTVAGSIVRLYQILSNGTRRLAGQITLGSASDGHAQFGQLTPGQYVAEVTGPNNSGGSVSFTVGTAEAANADVTLTNLGQVAGNVTVGGQAVAGARVLALDPITHAIVGVSVTDAAGHYTLTGLAAGTYELVVLQPGHLPAISTVVVTAAGTVSQDVSLVAGGPTLTGRVVDAQGNPVAGAGITVLDAAGRIVGYGTANPDGTFTVVGALGGVAIQVAAPGGPSSQASLTAELLGTATVAAGDVVAQVLASAQTTLAAQQAAEAFAAVQSLLVALDWETPQWLQIMLDNLSEGFERDPNEARFGDLIPITEDCIDQCGELLARAVREINMQDMQYERVVGFQEGVSILAKTALASLIAEPLYVLGSLAAAALAIKGLIVAAGWGFAVEGSAAFLYSVAQIGSNIYTIVDSLAQAIKATTPQDAIGALEYASNLMSNVFGLLTGTTELGFTLLSKTPAPSLGNFLGGTGNLFNLVGFVASLRGIWAAANFQTTIGILEELVDANATLDKVKESYQRQIATAHEAVNTYNRCMEACEREEDEDDDDSRPDVPDDDDSDDEDDVNMPAARDPNDILGPAGYGEQNWTAAPVGKSLGYTIRFENAADATAPAQVVTVTQQLDSDLDWRTFRIDGFGFGNVSVNLPGDRGFHVQRLDLRDVFGVYVDFSATIDPAAGTITFRFVAIDPTTGEVPTDPTVGFLPPEDGEGIGQGYVRYSIKPKATALTGTRVDAVASIVFDQNEAIDTPPIFNTLDRGTPTSSVATLPPSSSGVIRVKWGGSDTETADGQALETSGLTRFDIYVRINNGQWSKWLEDTTLLEADYLGEAGHTYMFYSVAKDLAGNVESAPISADAVTLVGDPNTTPEVTLGGNGTRVNEGSVFAGSGSFYDPDLSDAWTATVNYGDGTGDHALLLNPDGTFDLSHAYGDNGDYVVTVTVQDAAGAFSTKTIGVAVDNVAPTVSDVPDAVVQPGGTFSASAHFVDAGSADTHTATVDYGDGNGTQSLAFDAQGNFVLSKTYALPGTYTVTVTVTDDDGGVATQTLTVKVLAPAPVLTTPVQVNDGHVQRSTVKSLTLTFDQAVNFDLTKFVLKRRSDGLLVTLSAVLSADRKALTLSFASLADGVYDLAVAPGGVWNDDGVGITGGLSFSFHRLFGDVDGNGRINTVDVGAAKLALNSTAGSSKYKDYLDYDGNGVIDTTDFNEVRNRSGTNLYA